MVLAGLTRHGPACRACTPRAHRAARRGVRQRRAAPMCGGGARGRGASSAATHRVRDGCSRTREREGLTDAADRRLSSFGGRGLCIRDRSCPLRARRAPSTRCSRCARSSTASTCAIGLRSARSMCLEQSDLLEYMCSTGTVRVHVLDENMFLDDQYTCIIDLIAQGTLKACSRVGLLQNQQG